MAWMRAMPIAPASDAARLIQPLFAPPRGEKVVVLHLDEARHAITVE